MNTYRIARVERPDGRTIWRLVDVEDSRGIAAFDSEESAEEYLAFAKRRDAEFEKRQKKSKRRSLK